MAETPEEAGAEEARETTAAAPAEEAAPSDEPDVLAGRDVESGGAAMTPVSAIVSAAVLAAVALTGFLTWQVWQNHVVSAAGEAARTAAVGYAEILTSIDSDNLEADFDAVLNGAAGEFKDMYTKSSEQLRQLLIDNKATAHGVVVRSAVQSQSKNEVTVLLMVDQTVTNTERPDPRVDRSRMKITMEKVDGRWLASRVELP